MLEIPVRNKVLVIPDMHQCIGFVNSILERETDWNNVVFLGDYFDCFETPDGNTYFSVKETCKWLNSKREEWGNKAIWLLGNHDLSYLSTWIPNSYHIKKTQGYICCGWTGNKAKVFNKYIDSQWVHALKLCAKIGNYVCVHAGFHPKHFQPFISEWDNIIKSYEQWENEKFSFSHSPYHWIGVVGSCRGGWGEAGSPVWLDWTHEFVPLGNVKQIVGHTNDMNGHREYNGNFCIDGYRSCYAILQNNNLTVKYVDQ